MREGKKEKLQKRFFFGVFFFFITFSFIFQIVLLFFKAFFTSAPTKINLFLA